MTEQATTTDRKVHGERNAVLIAVAAWLVPGLGHALMRMWARSLACLVCVGALVLCGAGMRGNVFAWETSDPFSRLGFMADVGSGVFYWVARSIEIDGSDVSHAEGDYGTRLLAAAGVLNLLAAVHAYEAARGRKA
jgi:uncharacterized protein DUF6677